MAMARLLQSSSYNDGAFFHAYHAFECALTAIHVRLQPDASVSSHHEDRIDDGIEALNTSGDRPLAREAITLAAILDKRNQSLYVGYRGNGIRSPETDTAFEGSRVEKVINGLDVLLKKVVALMENQEPQ